MPNWRIFLSLTNIRLTLLHQRQIIILCTTLENLTRSKTEKKIVFIRVVDLKRLNAYIKTGSNQIRDRNISATKQK